MVLRINLHRLSAVALFWAVLFVCTSLTVSASDQEVLTGESKNMIPNEEAEGRDKGSSGWTFRCGSSSAPDGSWTSRWGIGSGPGGATYTYGSGSGRSGDGGGEGYGFSWGSASSSTSSGGGGGGDSCVYELACSPLPPGCGGGPAMASQCSRQQ